MPTLHERARSSGVVLMIDLATLVHSSTCFLYVFVLFQFAVVFLTLSNIILIIYLYCVYSSILYLKNKHLLKSNFNLSPAHIDCKPILLCFYIYFPLPFPSVSRSFFLDSSQSVSLNHDEYQHQRLVICSINNTSRPDSSYNPTLFTMPSTPRQSTRSCSRWHLPSRMFHVHGKHDKCRG